MWRTILERELEVLRGLASSRGDDDQIDKAEAELVRLRKIEKAAELACGLLWMMWSDFDTGRGRLAQPAFEALRDALGGPGSEGLRLAIKRALDAGYEADRAPGCDWWAGKKDNHEQDEMDQTS